MKEIIETYLARGRNAEHFQLNVDVLSVITPEFATKYKISSARGQYAALFAKEDEIYLRNQAYADTGAIDAKDRECDICFTTLTTSVDSYLHWPVAAKSEAATKLQYALKPFRKANSKPLAENRAMITNCIQALRSDEYSASVTLLGLDEIVNLLETKNNECNALMADRLEEQRSRAEADKLREIRPQVDAAFELVRKAINAMFLMNELVDQDATKKQEIGAVIDSVNKYLLAYTATLSRRGAGAKANVKPGTDIPSDPSGEDDRPVIE